MRGRIGGRKRRERERGEREREREREREKGGEGRREGGYKGQVKKFNYFGCCSLSSRIMRLMPLRTTTCDMIDTKCCILWE